MSISLTKCSFVKSAKNKQVFDNLCKFLKYDSREERFSLIDCKCNPPCELSEAEWDELEKRFKEAFDAEQADKA